MGRYVWRNWGVVFLLGALAALILSMAGCGEDATSTPAATTAPPPVERATPTPRPTEAPVSQPASTPAPVATARPTPRPTQTAGETSRPTANCNFDTRGDSKARSYRGANGYSYSCSSSRCDGARSAAATGEHDAAGPTDDGILEGFPELGRSPDAHV